MSMPLDGVDDALLTDDFEKITSAIIYWRYQLASRK